MNILFVCNAAIMGRVEPTVIDCVNAFKKYSQHNLHLISYKELSKHINHLDDYQAICLYKFHFTQESYISAEYKKIIRQYEGCKIVFLEEEYFIIDERIRNIEYMKFDIVFSTAHVDFIRRVYSIFSENIKVFKILHGYVEEYMLDQQHTPWRDRMIDVSYRALQLPCFYGRLGMEKNLIGLGFEQSAKDKGLVLDISNDFNKRLWGEDWHKLLRNSKAVLGVESCSGVVDFGRKIFDGALSFEKQHPNVSFDIIEKLYFNGLDGLYQTRSASPRIFEYAAFKNLMILFNGDYEGILEPNIHYVPLEKDFSNIDYVVDIIKDPIRSTQLVECAYTEIALNPKYHFSQHVEQFDRIVREHYSNVNLESLTCNHIMPEIERSLENAACLVDKLKSICKQKIKESSFVYTVLSRAYKLASSTRRLWTHINDIIDNKCYAAFWFAVFFMRRDEVVLLLSLLNHLKQREALYNRNILLINNTQHYCEVSSDQNKEYCMPLTEFLYLVCVVRQRYVLFKLHSAWHLNDEFRHDFIMQFRPLYYKFLGYFK